MKAVVISRFGPSHVLHIEERTEPEPGHGEVKIRVKAIGLNFADIFARLGLYPSIPKPPFVPGIELSGVIEKIGPGVKGFRRGDKVCAFTKQGAYAEAVTVPSEFVMKLPGRMAFREGAAILGTYLTAYHGLVTLAHLQRGEKVLIHAAAGGVGIAAVQISRWIGAEIFATAGSEEKLKVARDQGAHHLINYRTSDFEEEISNAAGGHSVDVVLDGVGGAIMKKGMRLLAPMGRYVLLGFSCMVSKRGVSRVRALSELARMPMIHASQMTSRNIGVFGFNLYFLANDARYLRKALSTIMALIEKKRLKPFVGATFSFDRIKEAHEYLQGRHSVGKVVILV